MAENLDMERMVDNALAELASDVAQGTPRPNADLMARVLADAAAVAPTVAAPRPVLGSAPANRSLLDSLFGWTSGAVATLALCLSVGIAVGMEMDGGEIPMTDPAESSLMAEADTFLVTGEGIL